MPSPRRPIRPAARRSKGRHAWKLPAPVKTHAEWYDELPGDLPGYARLAASGVGDEEIAAALGVPIEALDELPARRGAILRARAITGAQVAAALLRKAVKGHVQACVFYLKARHAWRDGDEAAAEAAAAAQRRKPRVLVLDPPDEEEEEARTIEATVAPEPQA